VKFLIVDDSYEDRLITRGYLNQEFGHDIEIQQASDPEEALSLIAKQKFDCILLDIHYGNSTRYTLIESLKDDDGELPSAVVVMTGSGSEEAAVSSLKLGAHDYLTKSNLNGTVLRKVIDYALNCYYLRQELRTRQDELERVNRELAHKDKLKTNFVASASHELRTPVAAMLGLLEMIGNTDLDAEQSQLVADLRACGDSLLLTVDDIIDLARVEAGIMEARPYAFHLIDEIQESLRPLRVLARDKKLTLESHIPEEIKPWRRGDRRRIRQILNNLVGNAIKYTDEGRVDVEISKGEGETLIFSVTDTGIGINDKDQARIFEPFYQADSHGDAKSSGLGLTTCVNLVKALRGELELESQLGVGSTFRFRIPLPEIAKPSLKEKSHRRGSGELAAAEPLQQLNLLLAEDNQIISNILQAQLENRNYTVYLASDGAKAVEIVKQESIDIILMDCQMPNMDGYEATKIIRQDLKLKIPVIALTADAFQSQRDRCVECGMNDILVKPVSVDELDAYLRNLKIP
jgi:two-component system, sensor histidine kinase